MSVPPSATPVQRPARAGTPARAWPVPLDRHARREDPRLRTAWMDAARVVAIVAVVLIHTVTPLVPIDTHGPTGSWWVGGVGQSLCRWAVPVFVMISGALLLGPDRRDLPVGTFLRRRLHRVGVPLVVWSAAYLVFRATWQHQPMPFSRALHDVVAGTPFGHLYFLYLIVGLYLVTPLLRPFVARASRRELVAVAALAFGFGVADDAITTWVHVGGPNAVTMGFPFAGYFLAGYLLRDAAPFGGRRGPLVAAATGLFAVTLAVAAGLSAVTTGEQARYPWHYLSPLTVAAALVVFVLLRSVFGPGTRLVALARSRWTHWLSGATFGVYLVHPMVLNVLFRWWSPVGSPAHAVGYVALLLMVVLVASTAITAVLQRLPLARHTV